MAKLSMKLAIKIFCLLLYWLISVEVIQWLINYPEDITFIIAIIIFFANCLLTIYIIKTKLI